MWAVLALVVVRSGGACCWPLGLVNRNGGAATASRARWPSCGTIGLVLNEESGGGILLVINDEERNLPGVGVAMNPLKVSRLRYQVELPVAVPVTGDVKE